jgi:hypothetical protein
VCALPWEDPVLFFLFTVFTLKKSKALYWTEEGGHIRRLLQELRCQIMKSWIEKVVLELEHQGRFQEEKQMGQ